MDGSSRYGVDTPSSIEAISEIRDKANGGEAISYTQEEVGILLRFIDETTAQVSSLNGQLTEVGAKLEKAIENNFVDSLTGCLNMKFYEKIKKDNFSLEKDRNKIAIVFIDVNGLREINNTPIEDGGGHDAGDQIIKDVSVYLRENFREEDIVIRPYDGGDEFYVICRNHDNDPNFEANLNKRVNFIRESTLAKSLPFSFATGVAVYGVTPEGQEADDGLDATKKRAEKSMYSCKNQMKSGQ
jgi:diguanylate cyclase (GGDEF)-like protein